MDVNRVQKAYLKCDRRSGVGFGWPEDVNNGKHVRGSILLRCGFVISVRRLVPQLFFVFLTKKYSYVKKNQYSRGLKCLTFGEVVVSHAHERVGGTRIGTSDLSWTFCGPNTLGWLFDVAYCNTFTMYDTNLRIVFAGNLKSLNHRSISAPCFVLKQPLSVLLVSWKPPLFPRGCRYTRLAFSFN